MENLFLMLYFLLPIIGICTVLAFIESRLASRKLPGFPRNYFGWGDDEHL